MQAKELRDLSRDELAARERELREDLFRLRMRKGTGQLPGGSSLRGRRQDLARVLTVLRERTKETDAK